MTRGSIAALAVATTALLGLPSAAEAFCNPPSRWSTPAHLALSAAVTSSDADGRGDGSVMAEGAPEAAAIPSAPGNPFLSLLSKGLHRTSIAMNKSTSDELFGATPSLQRMRRQVQQLTKKAKELFTSYGVVYWLGAVDAPEGEDDAEATERIKEQIVQSARDLQKALEGANTAYATEMADLEKVLGDL